MKKKLTHVRWLVTTLLLVAVTAVTHSAMAQGTLTHVRNSGGFEQNEIEGRYNDETADLLFDGNASTKWCYNAPSSNSPAWVIFKASTQGIICSYTITTGSDNSSNTNRNPKSWKIYGSNDEGDNKTWTELVKVTDDETLQDQDSKPFTFTVSPSSTNAFLYYKWEITENQGESVFQVSEFSITYSNCKDGQHEVEITLVKAKAATCIEKGYSQDFYQCNYCRKCYSDQAGTTEINIANITTDYADHTRGTDDEFCTVCHNPQHAGTTDAPILIGTAAELGYYRDWVNGTYTPAGGETATKHNEACGKLTADIDLSSVCSQSVGTWVPIASSYNLKWSGTFDGDNHTISYLYIDGNEQYQGLFGYIYTGTIKNVTFDQVTVKSSQNYTGTVVGKADDSSSLQGIIVNSGTVDGFEYTGGIAGYVYDSSITACCNKASVAGSGYVGGICGKSKNATISNCSNYASVKGTKFMGGIIGSANNDISYCANYGDVTGSTRIGGIAGYFNGEKMDNLLTTGSVTMSNFDTEYMDMIGFVAGRVSSETNNVTLTNTVGYNSSAKMTINGVVVESPSAIGKVNERVTITGECTAFDTDALKNGIAAYLLNSNAAGNCKWGQSLNSDAYPLINSDNQVYLNGDVQLNCIYHLSAGSLTNDANSTGTLAETKQHGEIISTSKAATCVKAGLDEHYECSLCHTIFTDANGTAEKSDLSDITIAATGTHEWDEDVTVRECKNHCGHFKVELNKGTEADPCLIYTAEELKWFRNWVNGELDSDESGKPIYHGDAHAKLMADIVFNENVLDADGNLNTAQAKFFNVWQPICKIETHDYTGVFDGQGHTIRGLYFQTNDSESGFALFGTNKGTIKNVGIADTYFQAMSILSGICNKNMGTIDNCFSFCTLKATYGGGIGGICGGNFGTVKNSFSAGNLLLEGNSTNYGGICGHNITEDFSGTTYTPVVQNCYYLSGMAPSAVYQVEDTENVKAMTTEQFKSGEVCYLLNEGKTDGTQRWYQNLSADGGDAYPNLNDTDKDNRTVYGAYKHEETTPICSNNSNIPNTHAHAYDSKATDEENGNHDKSYQGKFTWADNDDKTNATVTATFTCSVCSKVVTPELTVVHDDNKTNTAANCTTAGYNYYKTSYSFAGNTITDKYSQTLKALGHDMTGEVSLNSDKQIYQKGCKREGCDHVGYYATSAGSVVAKETEGGFVADALTLEDAKTYDNQAVFTATDFIYTRRFSNTNWTTWYVPFNLTLTKDICDKFAFSRINNVHQYDTDNDGKADKTVVESFRQTEGVTLKANYPYLVKALSESDKDMSLALENVSPALAEENSIYCQSVDYKYTFTGTYKSKEGGVNDTDPYTLTTDGYWRHFSSLKPMRNYMTIQSLDNSLVSSFAAQSILLSVIGEEDTTGIVKIYDEERRASETYDLSGRRLPAGSQRGLVIENGKVVFKK